MFYVSSVAGNGYLYAGSSRDARARALRRRGNSPRAVYASRYYAAILACNIPIILSSAISISDCKNVMARSVTPVDASRDGDRLDRYIFLFFFCHVREFCNKI